MSFSYVHEKFSAAIESMAASPESIQHRIANAYTYHLIRLKKEELPDEIRMDFEITAEQLTRGEPVGNEGRVMATVKQMSENEAVDIARRIVHMSDVVNAHYQSELAGD
jgi:hypothetical protein